jgi:hypothetical protein
MSASQVAGLLILLGVVGVLAAIVGSGIEAGPVKFPSIPGSRQKPLALASAVVIVGGVLWWAVQQQSGIRTRTPSIAGHSGAVANGKLRVVLLPARNNVRVGDALSVSAEVYDSLGDQLGTGQCVLTWSDRAVSDWKPTTQCIATASERSVSKAGVHRIVADADGRGGILATGRGSAVVTVGR